MSFSKYKKAATFTLCEGHMCRTFSEREQNNMMLVCHIGTGPLSESSWPTGTTAWEGAAPLTAK